MCQLTHVGQPHTAQIEWAVGLFARRHLGQPGSFASGRKRRKWREWRKWRKLANLANLIYLGQWLELISQVRLGTGRGQKLEANAHTGGGGG